MRFFKKKSSKKSKCVLAVDHDSIFSTTSKSIYIPNCDVAFRSALSASTSTAVSKASCLGSSEHFDSKTASNVLWAHADCVNLTPTSNDFSVETAKHAQAPSTIKEDILGKKKAVLIGINYPKSDFALRGCISDVDAIWSTLHLKFGYPASMICVLTDADSADASSKPTKSNILEKLKWLVADAHSGDYLFFHFSGHGYQIKDTSGDEIDGYDEAILPCDFETEGPIVDDVLYDILIRSLPEGVRLTAVFDSCHSGTALDLPYVYLHTGTLCTQPRAVRKLRHPLTLLSDFQETLKLSIPSPAHTETPPSTNILRNIFRYLQIKKKLKQNKKLLTSKADVIMFAACCDYQSSADAIIQGQPRGAMSWALLKAIENPDIVTYADILSYTRSFLSKKYNQTPQLSSGKLIDMYSPFMF